MATVQPGDVPANASTCQTGTPIIATTTTVSSGSSLGDLIAEFDRLGAEAEAYDDDVVEPAIKALNGEIASVPHFITTASYMSRSGERIHPTTAEPGTEGMMRAIVRDLADREGAQGQEYMITARELVAGADARDARIAAIRQRHNIELLRQRSDAIWSRLGPAREAIRRFPAASLADLVEKIEWMQDGELFEIEDTATLIIADIRRLSGSAEA